MSIKLSNIYHTYSKGTPFERLALNDVSLEITKGEEAQASQLKALQSYRNTDNRQTP